MLLELILMLLIAALFFLLGWLLWKKEKIELVHTWHRSKVSEKNRGPYTTMMGKGLVIMGIGSLLTGVIDYAAKTEWGWAVFTAGFVIGLVYLISAGKYNR